MREFSEANRGPNCLQASSFSQAAHRSAELCSHNELSTCKKTGSRESSQPRAEEQLCKETTWRGQCLCAVESGYMTKTLKWRQQ